MSKMIQLSEAERYKALLFDSVFGTENGQSVLAVLREDLGVEESHSQAEWTAHTAKTAIDPIAYWLGEGRKSTYWHIMAKLRAANTLRAEVPEERSVE